MDSRIKEMLEKGLHEDVDEQGIEDEGVCGSRGVPGPRNNAGPHGARKWTAIFEQDCWGIDFSTAKNRKASPEEELSFAK